MNEAGSTIEGSMTEAENMARSMGDDVAVVLTNPNLPDNPIIYLNTAFERITGYSRAAAIGRNCRFLQGADTDPEAVRLIRDAVDNSKELSVDLLNYRADGEAFWNRLVLSPLTDDEGNVSYFIGIQKRIGGGGKKPNPEREETLVALRELQHRVKNHLSMIVSMIRLQAREESPQADFGTLSRRIETLQLLYEEMSGRDNGDANVALGAYVSRVASTIGHLDGRQGIRVNVQTVSCEASPEIATQIGFLVSEILTNALKHAFTGRETGTVDLTMEMRDDDTLRIEVSDDGLGLPEGIDWPDGGGLGSRIVRQVAISLDCKVRTEARPDGGTRIWADIDLGQLG
ncbi:PAS domain-containing protein [Salipiger sp. IMCC34102]|uniref:PAS domain-containing protein n=1 Tax=Salipiger sp. IMCC34102 TaxID=2510647 RepID=UPI0013EDF36C|nr:PAS domain-containing protein [Salipiger sp. IMCC34102]